MGSPISPLIANIFMEEFEVKALSSTPHPLPSWLRSVDDTSIVNRAEHSKALLQHINSQDPHIHAHSGTNTTRLTPIPRHFSHNTTRQHIQHFSLQETNPHRPISTLGQQPPHHSQTKYIQHISTQSQGSLLYTRPTYQDSITTVPFPRLGPQPLASKVYQPPPNQQQQQSQQQPTRQQQQQIEHHHSCTIQGKSSGKCAKGKEYRFIFKGTNTLRTMLGNPKDKDPKNNQTGIIYCYKYP